MTRTIPKGYELVAHSIKSADDARLVAIEHGGEVARDRPGTWSVIRAKTPHPGTPAMIAKTIGQLLSSHAGRTSRYRP